MNIAAETVGKSLSAMYLAQEFYARQSHMAIAVTKAMLAANPYVSFPPKPVPAPAPKKVTANPAAARRVKPAVKAKPVATPSAVPTENAQLGKPVTAETKLAPVKNPTRAPRKAVTKAVPKVAAAKPIKATGPKPMANGTVTAKPAKPTALKPAAARATTAKSAKPEPAAKHAASKAAASNPKVAPAAAKPKVAPVAEKPKPAPVAAPKAVWVAAKPEMASVPTPKAARKAQAAKPTTSTATGRKRAPSKPSVPDFSKPRD